MVRVPGSPRAYYAGLPEAGHDTGKRMKGIVRPAVALLLAVACSTAAAAVDPDDRGERWWDASRADRIDFSNRAAAACKSRHCDSLQIRSCLNETLKPPVSKAIRERTLAEVTATCIAGFNAKP